MLFVAHVQAVKLCIASVKLVLYKSLTIILNMTYSFYWFVTFLVYFCNIHFPYKPTHAPDVLERQRRVENVKLLKSELKLPA